MKVIENVEPTNTTVELDQRNIFNTPVIPINVSHVYFYC